MFPTNAPQKLLRWFASVCGVQWRNKLCRAHKGREAEARVQRYPPLRYTVSTDAKSLPASWSCSIVSGKSGIFYSDVKRLDCVMKVIISLSSLYFCVIEYQYHRHRPLCQDNAKCVSIKCASSPLAFKNIAYTFFLVVADLFKLSRGICIISFHIYSNTNTFLSYSYSRFVKVRA